ncbi:hypothetical protein EWM64_g9022 [Hericium alpestre]|uniref:PEBP-like protein n=1 Tax=Hericium alpestre TaxID=135208 RepID=A0A4Y9ZL60_9AGAM|nr:hypothetical protein EWM64_g9022 [Hericium alpestre]
MYSLLISLVLSLFLPCNAQSNSTNVTISAVEQAFNASHIVPDILASFNPTSIIDVVFTDPSTNTTIAVTPGINLTMEQTLLEPQFFLTSNDTSLVNQTFVLALIDPDAPTPQDTSESQFRHLLAGNFHVNGSTNHSLLTNSSAALTDYVNPTPPVGSDPHRYTILLFIQPSNFDNASSLVNASTPRPNFNLTTFGDQVNLGSPIAGTYFLTKADNTTTNSTSGAPSPSPSTASSGTVGLPQSWESMEMGISMVVAGLLSQLLL